MLCQQSVHLEYMTTVFFLRHGQTKENVEERVQGQQPGTLLIPETERYLAAVVPLLRTKNPTVLVSSDLARAVATRDILNKFLQLPHVHTDTTPLLRERAMGIYEGMLWADVPPEFAAQRREETYDFRSLGGERDADVLQRVADTLTYLVSHYPNQRICCVTHAGWLRQLFRAAHKEGVLSDGWTHRIAIYEGGLSSKGQLDYLRSVLLEAKIPADED